MNRALFLLPLMMLVDPGGLLRLVAAVGPRSGVDRLGDDRPAGAGAAVRRARLLKSGKPVLVNFFASWCAPCLAEHPLFTRLKEREGATIIGIAWKDKPEATRAWLAKLGDPFAQIGFDQDGKLALDWGLSGVPETYLIDAQGIVRLHFRGPITERDLATILPLLRAGR